eukprot:scaffold53051_cov18-Tisochrysis_lutea.AAC.2
MGCGQKCRALFWRYVAHCSVQMHWCILGEANPKALMCPIQSAEGMTCNLHALSTSKLVVRVDKLLVLVFHTSTPLPDGSFSVCHSSCTQSFDMFAFMDQSNKDLLAASRFD